MLLGQNSCSVSWHIFFRKCHFVSRLSLYLDGLDNYLRINSELMRYPVFPYICPNYICAIKIKDLLLWLLYCLIKFQIIPDSNKLTWYQINLPQWKISHQIVFDSEFWLSQDINVLGLWMHSFTYSLIHVFCKHIHTFEILSTKMWVGDVSMKNVD